jgi:CcmD family protein
MLKVVMSCLMLLFFVCTHAQEKMRLDSTVEIKMIKTIDPATGKETVKADTVRTGVMRPNDGKERSNQKMEVRVIKSIDSATGKEVVTADTTFTNELRPLNDKPPVEMADQFRKDGKIYVVVAVCMIVLLSMLLYMFSLDRKVRKLEELTKK